MYYTADLRDESGFHGIIRRTALHSYLPTVKERQTYVADLAR
jgi:hypothetical protein